MTRRFLLATCALSALSVLAAEPTISNATLTTGGRIVTVDYTLQNGPAIVTAEFSTNGIPLDSGWPFVMVGHVASVVTNANCRFCWTVDLAHPDLDTSTLAVTLKAWETNTPPDYVVADFTRLTNFWYFASEASLPGGISNPAFRTNSIVMRRIPHSSSDWRMGYDPETYPGISSSYTNQVKAHYVKLTKDYYIGVFALTQGQFRYFQGRLNKSALQSVENGYPDGDFKPLTAYAYNEVRGYKDWPSEGHAVTAGYFMDKIRKQTGIEFDFPTDAQWEYACRAGTSTCQYNGKDTSSASIQEIAWFYENSSQGYTNAQPHSVGLKKPNDFGLYDMIGNSYEFALDWFKADLTGDDYHLDPVGPTATTRDYEERVTRTGNFSQGAGDQLSYLRRKCPPTLGSPNNGFRLACPCPLPIYYCK